MSSTSSPAVRAAPVSTRRAAAFGVALVTLIAGTGCTRAIVNSRRAPDYDKKLDRVLIACPLQHLGKSFAEAFKTRLVAELAKRGATARFAVLDDALAVESGPSLDDQAREFHATSALILRKSGGVVNQYGGVLWSNFDSEIIDLQQKRRVWRGQIQFHPAWGADADSKVLTNEIVRALVADLLITGPFPPTLDSESATPPT